MVHHVDKALTYRQAARRVRRSVRTLKRWRRNGMPMEWQDGHLVVEESVLLAWWRDRMSADPVHQQRIRRMGSGV
ncbi:hypothetical protein [Microbacterium sp. 8M]|uniref:hypothetical protein n=1 Tax=Microbacterium sp. 8M TaxID=2653153 RepID=UPI001359EFD6|nr:hypothetical protein [Microbacterium sp. 8M]